MYSHVCKQKKRAFQRNIIDKLDKLSKYEPSEDWKLVKELKDENSSDDPSDKISPDVCISHFSKLFSVKKQFQKLNNDFKDKLSNLKKNKQKKLQHFQN